MLIFFLVAQQPLVGQGRLIVGATRSHSDTRQLVPETSALQHTSLTTNIDAPRRDSNLQSQQSSGRRPTP